MLPRLRGEVFRVSPSFAPPGTEFTTPFRFNQNVNSIDREETKWETGGTRGARN
jgi:hypothetical protein